jgi:hypothetical protein
MWVELVLDPIALECAEVIRIAELSPQILEDLPVARLTLDPERLLEVAPKVTLHSIVVKKSVVDIQKEDDVAFLSHHPISLALALGQPSGIVNPAVKPEKRVFRWSRRHLTVRRQGVTLQSIDRLFGRAMFGHVI